MSNTDINDPSAIPGTASQPGVAGTPLASSNGFTVVAGAAKPPAGAPASGATVAPGPAPAAGGAPMPLHDKADPGTMQTFQHPTSTQVDMTGAPADEPSYLAGKFGQNAIKARLAGASWDQINAGFEGRIQDARKAGATDDQIATGMGWDAGKTQKFEAMLNTHAANTYANLPVDPSKQNDDGTNDSLWDSFWNAATHGSIPSGVRLITNTADQVYVAKQYPDIFRQTAQMFGYVVSGAGELAAGAGATGAATGAVVGSVVPGVGTGAGALVGAALFVGAAIMNDGAIRDTAAQGQGLNNFGQRYIAAAVAHAPDGLIAGAATLTAGVVNPLVAKTAIPVALQWGTKAAAQVATLATISAGVNGRVPNMQDVTDAAIGVAAFDVLAKAGKIGLGVAAKGASKAIEAAAPKPTEADVHVAMDGLMRSYVRTGELPQSVIPRIQNETSIDGLIARDVKQNGAIPPADEAAIRKAWEDQGVADFSPLTRGRWYASAVDQGPEEAGQLLEASGGNPDRFNEFRAAKLLPEYQADPKSFDGTLEKYLTRMDSRPPQSPEAALQDAKDAKDPTELQKTLGPQPIKSGFLHGLEDAYNRLTTMAAARRIYARKLADLVLPRLKVPSEDGRFRTLDAKFAAHMRGEVELTPQEDKVFHETIGGLAAIHKQLVDTVQAMKDEGDEPDVTGKKNPIPFLRNKDLTEFSTVRGTSALGEILSKIIRMQDVVSYKTTADNLKASPEFQANTLDATQYGEEIGKPVPAGYSRIRSPAFKDYYVDDRIADVVNDFIGSAKNGKVGDLLEKANQLAIGAMFALPDGAIAHDFKNVAIGTWLPARGFDNFTNMPKFGRALHAVNSLSPEYLEVLSHGGSLISARIGDNSITSYVLKSLGEGIAKDPNRWGPTIKAMGFNKFADFAGNWQTFVSKEMFRMQDYLYMQRYFELRDKGLDVDQAIHDVELFMPTYRMPSRLFGARFPTAGRWASSILSNLNIAAFGRYEVSKYTALANGLRTVINPKASYEGRTAAVGRLFMSSLMMTAGQAAMNDIVQHLTGNENANWFFGGPLGIAQKTEKFVLSPSADAFRNLVGTLFTFSPGVAELTQQTVAGTDFFTGKRIVSPGASIPEAGVERVNHASKGFNVQPVFDFAGALPGYFSDPASAVPDIGEYVGKGLGLSNPSDAAQFFNDGGMSSSQRREERRTRAGLPGFEQDMLDAVGG